MSTETNNTAVVPATPAVPAAIVFTVKANDIVKGTIAKIKQHPDKGILVVIAGNPMSFMPNGCVAGKNDAEKATRRAFLLANPGTEIEVAVMSEPTIETVKGPKGEKQVGRIKVSEQRAVMVADKAKQAARNAERTAAIEEAVASLVEGTVIEGVVRGPASKDSDREPGKQYTYGAYITVAPNVSGLLHVKEIDGGHRALEAILASGKATVEILSAKMEDGRPRIQLSQKTVGQKEFFAQYPVDATVKGKIVKTGEQVDNLHGRIIVLGSGARVFLCDDDSHVKSESSLAKGNSTRVTITSEIVGGMVRVTRKGL
jgi:ribosomal protein S1